MSESKWLIDKSALVRLATSSEASSWAGRIERGLVHISTITLLEVGYSARSAENIISMSRTSPLSAMPIEYLTPVVEDRAIEVQRRLAERGQHRATSIPDLIVAAAAEASQLVVLHVDKDFDLIAAVTGQPVQSLLP